MLKDYSVVVAALGGDPSKEKQNVRCPAHNDDNPSLSVWQDKEGRTAIKCFAGCAYADVVAAINKITGEPEKENKIKKDKYTILKLLGSEPELPKQLNEVARYFYPGRGYVVRCEPKGKKKQFYPYQYCRNNETGEIGWACTGFKGKKPIYKNAHVKDTNKGILIVEGEKCVDALGKLSIPAATWMGGAAAIANADWDSLPKEPAWYYWPDADDAGAKAAEWFAKNFKQATIIKNPEGVEQGWDVADAIEQGWDVARIKEFVNAQRKPVEEEEEVKLLDYVIPMGYNKEGFFYFVKEAKMVYHLSTSEHNKNKYLSLAPLSIWESCFNNGRDVGNKDWDNITDLLFRQCYSKGYLTLDRLRGRGTWFDDGRLVVHLGNRMYVDGQAVELGALKSDFVYEIGEALPSVSDAPLTKDQSKHLLDVCRHLRWQNENMGLLLAGFIALAPISGCLKWRPHIYVTGAKQSGKTTVMNDIVSKVLGQWGVSIVGGATEAGIRSKVKFDSLTVIYDEGGIESEREKMVMDAVVKLARSASSSEGAILKGTAGGGSVEYNIRSMFVFSSVNPNITNDQDQSRIALLSLVPARKHDPEAEEHYKKLLQMLAVMTDDWCGRLIARSISLTHVTLQNIQIFRAVCQKKYGDARKGDQFGTLIAGAYSLVSDDVVSADAAMKWIDDHNIQDAFFGTDSTDEERCWDRLMQYRVLLSTSVRPPVGEMIDLIMSDSEGDGTYGRDWADKELRRMGIRVDRKDRCVWVASESDEIKRIYKATPWVDYMTTLKRLSFCDNTRASTQRVCGQIKKCYRFNFSIDT